MDKPSIFFVSGLPRSGSTLLMNLLGQNPAHHVTPTNGLLDLTVLIRDRWTDLIEFKSQGVTACQPRIVSLMRGMIEGYYRAEFQAGKTVFDKCRGWLHYIELMEEVLQRPIVVLVTVRDIRAIVASFEKLYLENSVTSPRPSDYLVGQTVEGRSALLLSNEGMLGLAINRLRDALRRTRRSKILMIPYNQLCLNTQAVLDQLHGALGLPLFKYDPDNVQQLTYEDDSVHGMSLHKVRSKVSLEDKMPWKKYLSDQLCDRLIREYADIQRFSESA